MEPAELAEEGSSGRGSSVRPLLARLRGQSGQEVFSKMFHASGYSETASTSTGPPSYSAASRRHRSSLTNTPYCEGFLLARRNEAGWGDDIQTVEVH
jgi:hypothetical protein